MKQFALATPPWSLEGRIKRLPYLGWGLALFAVKYGIDTLVAEAFGKAWSLYYYLSPVQVSQLVNAPSGLSYPFYAAIFGSALPFVWLGVSLTVQRLRNAGLPLWPVFLFFAPVINFAFFVVLSLLPSSAKVRTATATPGQALTHVVPKRRMGSAAAAVALTAGLGVLLTGFSVYGLAIYGLGLFVGLPFCLGLIAAVVHGYHGARGCRECLAVAFSAVVVAALMLVLLAVEGAVCIVMAAPLWIGCALLGGTVGYLIQLHARDQREAALIVIGLSLAIPTLLGAEALTAPPSPVYAVRSTVEIAAPREQVWGNVIAFPDLPPPTELVFRAGVAYPMGARIEGCGAGAMRHCVFSTGSFVEPIEVWNEPSLLKFAVTSSPPPMREWTFYDSIHPPHLEGYLNSKAGQFLLTPLSNGGTRLEGTTWYQHNMWPAEYWRWWSDALIHRIHLRVLEHVRSLSERHDSLPQR